MPEVLRKFLEGLSPEDANKVWEYLDSTADVTAFEMLDIVAQIAKEK